VGAVLKSLIAYIDMSCFVHGTEDPEKVIKALQTAVPSEHSDKIVLGRSKLKGDYGNPIIFLKTKIEDETVAESVLRHISSQLSTPDKQNLLRELRLHLEKGSLYMRFDKQAAFRGDLRLCTGDPIHMRIRFRKNKDEDVAKILADFGLLPMWNMS